jgi:hypothetical protein
MNKISCSGGEGNEAIEVGLQHAVYEAINCGDVPLHQVFLIGDMPPNTMNEVKSKRVSEKKWKGTNFENLVYWETELQKL